MLIDSLNEFSDAQAITATAASTNVIDLGAAKNTALGRELYIHAIVETLFASADEDGTLDITVQTDSVSTFATPTTIATFTQVAEAALVDGLVISQLRVPANTERYIRLYFTVGGTGNFTAGKIDAFLSPSLQDTFDVT